MRFCGRRRMKPTKYTMFVLFTWGVMFVFAYFLLTMNCATSTTTKTMSQTYQRFTNQTLSAVLWTGDERLRKPEPTTSPSKFQTSTPRTVQTTIYDPPWRCSGCFNWSYQVVINQDAICRSHGRNHSIDLIFLIPSLHDKTAQRSAIRETWASVTRNNTSNFRHVFLFGVTKDPERMRIVETESRQFRDVVMMGFEDTYRNLTVKTMTSLRWLTENCPQARFFLKVDDDMWINSRVLMEQLNKRESQLQNATAGHCTMVSKVLRDSKNKWSATRAEYPADAYPEYCSGTAYAGTVNVARHLVSVSRNVPFFHLEDVFVGLCLRQLRYPVKNLAGFHLNPPGTVRKDVCAVWRPEVVSIHRVPPASLYKYWNAKCGNRTELLPRIVDVH